MKTPNDFNPIITERIKQAISESGLARWKIVKLTGISQTALDSYIYDGVMPSAARLASLCHVLGVNPAWIMGLSGLKII